ncbi:MAG: right-handed parallel beta-helix repeat-containing protein [Myxococcales bacterium]|nr:right-handed parallel beta-helix repeat-containing protein [Myxococcales bacterium]
MRLALGASARYGACIDRVLGAEWVEAFLRAGPLEGDESRALFECMTGASHCSQLLGQCLSRDTARPCTPSFAPRCENDIAVNCHDAGELGYVVSARDCGLVAEAPHCVVGIEAAHCSPTAEPCRTASCDGAALTWCDDGVAASLSCDDLGLSCGEWGAAPEGPSCGLASACAPVCEDDVLTFCVADGPVDRSTVNCAALGSGWGCDVGPEGAPACVARAVDCAHGETRCDGDVLETCVYGAWVGTDCRSFADGRCVSEPEGARCEESAASRRQPRCRDECEVIGASCVDASTRATCAQVGSCRRRTLVSCVEGRCFEGECLPPCVPECVDDGATRCVGDAVSRCEPDETGCLAWSAAEACGASSWCLGGTCATCDDECAAPGVLSCAEGAVIGCQNVDEEPCLDVVVVETCAVGQVCDAGACVPDCDDTCETVGATQCNGGFVSTCGDSNADGCLEWSPWSTCGEGKSCQGDACACDSACPNGSTVGCVGEQPVTCEPVTGGCPDFFASGDCDSPLVCDQGVCGPGPVVVISELARLGDVTAIELGGPPGLNLLGWTLDVFTGPSDEFFTLTGTIGPSGYWVITDAPPPTDYAQLAGQPVGFAEHGVIILRQGERVVDSVAFGAVPGGPKGHSGEGEPAGPLMPNYVLARNALGRDTEHNSRDFRAFTTHTLGLPNLWPNVAPTAHLGCPSHATLGKPATFDTSGTYDFDDTPVSTLLDFGDGVLTYSETTSHVYTSVGSYTVSITVVDAQGLIDVDSCILTVHEPDPPTITWITPETDIVVSPGKWVPVEVDAQAAPGRAIAFVTFLVDGAPVSGATVSAPPYRRLLKVPSTSNTVEVRALARDEVGEETLSEARVITSLDTPPVAALSAEVVDLLTARFDPTGSKDADGDVTIRWDVGGDGVYDTEWGPLDALTWTFPEAGTVTVRVAVRDSSGQIVTAEASVALVSERTVSSVVSDEVWFGTVRLVGEVVIPAGVTVKTTSNAVVVSDTASPALLTVRGVLESDGGTTFGTSPPGPRLDLEIDGGGTVALTAATFVGAGIRVAGGELWLTDSGIDGGAGIRVDGGSASLAGVDLTEAGVVVSPGASVSMSASSVSGAPGIGLDIRDGHVDVRTSSIRANGDVGVWLSGAATGVIERSTLADNALEGLRISARGNALPSVTVELNDISGNSRSGYTEVVAAEGASLTSSGVGSVSSSLATSAPVVLASVSYQEPIDTLGQLHGTIRRDDGTVEATFESDTIHEGVLTPYVVRFSPPSMGLILDVNDQSADGNAVIDVVTLALVRSGLEPGTFPSREAVVVTSDGSPYPLRRNWWGRTSALADLVAVNAASVDLSGFALGPLNDGPVPGEPGTVPSTLITGDVVWEGKRILAGRITVGSEARLTLAAGCELELAVLAPASASGATASVEVAAGGTLRLLGTADAPVRTTRSEHGESSVTSTRGSHAAFRTLPGSVLEATHVDSEGAPITFDLVGGIASLDHIVARNTSTGVRVGSVASLDLSWSTIIGALDSGIAIVGAPTAAVIRHTTVADGLGWGVHAEIAGPLPVDLEHVAFTRNVAGGLFVRAGLVTVDSAEVIENGYGVLVAATGAVAMAGSRVTANGLEGIAVLTRHVPPSMSFTGNDIVGNGTAGGTTSLEWSFVGSSTSTGLETVSTTIVAPPNQTILGVQVVALDLPDAGPTTATSEPTALEVTEWATPSAEPTSFADLLAPLDEWIVFPSGTSTEVQVTVKDRSTQGLVSLAVPVIALAQRSLPIGRDLVCLTPVGTLLDASGNYWGGEAPAVESLLGGAIDTSGALEGPVTPP